ncbi:FAD:protein FMN transferase [uncultured Parasutterella sp.]|uniref:FAD:protein FMN transferase n=1 Tax=uncultured Parasutterella sp. TaxID=1263098 RepID=UPI0025B4E8FE|nr:FAD:protein FMN transferase [uncultured Parasutterella sp.]
MFNVKPLCAALVLGAGFSASAYAETDVYHHAFDALGTVVTTQFKTESQVKADYCEKVTEDEVNRLELLLSAYKPDSDLSRLGAAKGEWIKISKDTADILERTKEVCAMTHGALDPTVGTLVKLWSVDHDNHRVPSDKEIAEALPKVDWTKIEVKKEGDQYYGKIGAGQEITLGATGKGFIADKVIEKLRAAGCKDALISLGGNVITSGTNYSGNPWLIGLQEPDLKRGGYFAAVPSRDESVVTSGDYEKFFIKDGKKYHHILDPRTGRPVPATLSSVSIIHKNSAYADGLCTSLFVMGWQGAIDFLRAHPELKAVLVDEPLKTVVYTPNLDDEIKFTNENFRIGVIEPLEADKGQRASEPKAGDQK